MESYSYCLGLTKKGILVVQVWALLKATPKKPTPTDSGPCTSSSSSSEWCPKVPSFVRCFFGLPRFLAALWVLVRAHLHPTNGVSAKYCCLHTSEKKGVLSNEHSETLAGSRFSTWQVGNLAVATRPGFEHSRILSFW